MKQHKNFYLPGLLLLIGFSFIIISCVTSPEVKDIETDILPTVNEDRFAPVDRLIAEKKYNSAFKLLSEMNHGDLSDVEILVKQFRFIPLYFLQSTMHQMFIFKDLKPDERLMELRSYLPEGEYEYTLFDPIEIHKLFVEQYGPSPELDLALGEFYLDAIYRYGDQWLVSPEDVQLKVLDLFTTANTILLEKY